MKSSDQSRFRNSRVDAPSVHSHVTIVSDAGGHFFFRLATRVFVFIRSSLRSSIVALGVPCCRVVFSNNRFCKIPEYSLSKYFFFSYKFGINFPYLLRTFVARHSMSRILSKILHLSISFNGKKKKEKKRKKK